MASEQQRGRKATAAPFAARLPRTLKRSAGRTSVASTPANIRVFGVDLDRADRDEIRQQLGRGLGKHAGTIERVTVRLRDVNGPRGGVDHVCSIKVVLTARPSVVSEKKAATAGAAFKLALAAAERAVADGVRQGRSVRRTKAE